MDEEFRERQLDKLKAFCLEHDVDITPQIIAIFYFAIGVGIEIFKKMFDEEATDGKSTEYINNQLACRSIVLEKCKIFEENRRIKKTYENFVKWSRNNFRENIMNQIAMKEFLIVLRICGEYAKNGEPSYSGLKTYCEEK